MVTRIVNTYAWRNAIKSSKNITAVTIAQGNTEIIIIREPEVRSAQENPIKILRSGDLTSYLQIIECLSLVLVQYRIPLR